MMRYAIIFLFVLNSLNSFGQKNLLGLIEYSNKEGQLFPVTPGTHLYEIGDAFKYLNFRHNYLIHRKQLYIQIDGTGKIYRYDLYNKKITRIDSTYFEGYNFGAYTYSWKNKFYSLGGWGFWQFNGGLRYFDERQKEWDVIPLDIEIPFSLKVNSIAWHDRKYDKIYILYNPQKNSYTRNFKSVSKDTVLLQCFDLKLVKWWERPKLTSFQSSNLFEYNESFNIGLSDGLLIRGLNSTLFIDFRNNQILKANNELLNELNTLYLKYTKGFFLNRDSTVFFYNPLIDSLSSIRITKNAFVKTTQKIYYTSLMSVDDNLFNNNIFLRISILLLLFTIGVLIFVIYKKQKLQATENAIFEILERKKGIKKLDINSTLSFSNNLTEQERSVFELILENSNNNEPTTIGQINLKLGVKNKDVTVQNQLRSDVIQMINKKFNVFASTADMLIEREKTVFDKRVFEYWINKRYLNKL